MGGHLTSLCCRNTTSYQANCEQSHEQRQSEERALRGRVPEEDCAEERGMSWFLTDTTSSESSVFGYVVCQVLSASPFPQLLIP